MKPIFDPDLRPELRPYNNENYKIYEYKIGGGWVVTNLENEVVYSMINNYPKGRIIKDFNELKLRK